MSFELRIQTLGPYKLGTRLGLGGMAEVFLAEHDRWGQVAVKRILPGLAEDREFADMFWDEARITSRFDHPSVIQVLDYGRIDGQLYMALEYVDGPSLARLLRKAAKEKRHLSMPALVTIVVQLLDALHYVHTLNDERGSPLAIVHRDISPGNVMLSARGQTKLGDFGIVRSQAVMRRTQPGELKGKIGYMSPEQATGATVTPQSDIFSVGIILAEFLTLKPLFLGKNEMQTLSRTVQVDLSTWHRFNAQVPLPMRSIVEKALSSDLSVRYTSAAEMRDAIVAVARDKGWVMEPLAVADELIQLGMVEASSEKSGERLAVRLHGDRDVYASHAEVAQEAAASQELLGNQGSREGNRITPITLELNPGVKAAPSHSGASAGNVTDRITVTEPFQAQVPHHLRASEQQTLPEAQVKSSSSSGAWIIQELGGRRRPQGKPVWNVQFQRRSLPAQLFLAFQRARNGAIELSVDGESLVLEMADGHVVGSYDSTGRFALGRLLVEESLLSSSELVTAIGESRRCEMRLGEYLVAQGKLRQSVIARLLKKQFEARLTAFMQHDEGSLAVYVFAGVRGLHDSDGPPASFAQLVAAMRPLWTEERLQRALAHVWNAIVLPANAAPLVAFGLTDPEVRALSTTMVGGAYEGYSLGRIVSALSEERLARPRESMFALFVGLSGGLVQSPGFLG